MFKKLFEHKKKLTDLWKPNQWFCQLTFSSVSVNSSILATADLISK